MNGRTKFLLAVAAPVGAAIIAVIVTSLVLLATGHSPGDALDAIVGAFEQNRTLINTFNVAANYYLAAVAVAIGFKMNLFNIGVDGQYRLAALLAAWVAGMSFMNGLPSVLRIVITILVAMIVGAAWASIAALLKVTRGVSEVISTIMLNAIGLALGAWLLSTDHLAVAVGNNVSTKPITEGGTIPTIAIGGSSTPLYPMIGLALLVGLIYAFLLSRTVFGFSIKATGMSESAAVASGINVKKMVFAAMLLSGAVAGLVGMPELLNGREGAFSLNFPTGIGFIGIAVALLGRNHPVGMILASLLWSALDASSNSLQGADIPKELVTIMQGVLLFAVVIAYEIVRRARRRLEQRTVARTLAATPPPGSAGPDAGGPGGGGRDDGPDDPVPAGPGTPDLQKAVTS